jgi:hypothetical protein
MLSSHVDGQECVRVFDSNGMWPKFCIDFRYQPDTRCLDLASDAKTGANAQVISTDC